MTVHVLHAGDGYTYLTRQVASGDHLRRRGEALSDYYTAAGNPPGRWVGTGRTAMGIHGTGIDGAGVDAAVTEAQMKALFGQGLHPDAQARVEQAVAAGQDRAQAVAALRLGARFPAIHASQQVWRDRLDTAYASFEKAHGARPERGPERDLVRWNVATALFRETEHRDPFDDAELKRFHARAAKPARQPVAGVDLVFTPVKSVSTLWALGDEPVRRQVELAHEAAWRRAFAYLESHAALTRTGAAGIAQVETHGLVAAAFDHPDSRTGDPNLHTHVAVSAKVQGLDGKWRALDMRVLHAMAVSASETYNTAVEDELRTRLRVAFVERAGGRDPRPVREIAGIPPALLRAFSSRRVQIETGYHAALERYRSTHGHDAPRHVQYQLAQEATLANRPDKSTPRSWADARQAWLARARQVLAASADPGPADVATMLRGVLGHGIPAGDPPPADVEELARAVVQAVAQARSTWTRWHVHAQAQRLTRPLPVAPAERDALVASVTDRALTGHSLALRAPELNPAPGPLLRRDGESVYSVHGATRYTSEPLVLAVEDALLAASDTHTGRATPEAVLAGARARLEATHGWSFDPGQVALARAFTGDDRLLVTGVGPAGTGKTTAMQLTAAVLAADGRRLIALAPSARAAAVLGQQVRVPATTIAKLLHAHDQAAEKAADQAAGTGFAVPDELRLRPGDVVLVDEAGMAGTPTLGRLLTLARDCGALLRLLGDPMQLGAVEAGGALRLLAHADRVTHLDRVHRFVDPAEADASLALRRGLVSGLGFYEANGRLRDGSREAMVELVYDRWRADRGAGHLSLMVSASSAEVAALSARARRDRVSTGQVSDRGVLLHDGNTAGAGDLVVTRENQRLLSVRGGRDFVKNGDLWRVTACHDNGDLSVRHTEHGGRVRLPAGYAAGHVELGYATTVHRAQGMTVETGHVLVDKSMTRESLYVALSRGRLANRAYVVTDEAIDVDLHRPPGPRLDAMDVLQGVLSRQGSELSATETLTETVEAAESLATLVPQYLDGHARAVVTGDLEAAVRAGLRDAGGRGLEQRVSESPAWPRLLTACAGTDPRDRVAEAVRSRLPDGAEPVQDRVHDPAHDPAAVLAWRVWRLDEPATVPGQVPSSYPPWLPAPPPALAPGPVGDWVQHQHRLITARVAALVEQVAVNPPPWAAGLSPRPEGGPARGRWEADVGVVAAYRDQYRIPDDAELPGPHAAHSHQSQARQAALLAWQRLRLPPAEPGPGSVSVNERLRALAVGRPQPAGAEDALAGLRDDRRKAAEVRAHGPSRTGLAERGPRL